ncbi:hypothetical protein D917_10256, partial [Trichinella nativa]
MVINQFGMPEEFELLSVDQVNELLIKNYARKDGFVRCIRLSTAEGAPLRQEKVIRASENQSGELSSGIRTRRSDCSDIVYVEIDNVRLPSILVAGVQSVRLADVLRLVLLKNEPTVQLRHLSDLKQMCADLHIPIRKCSNNEKARLVVCAKSYHCSSLHVIPVDQLARLVARA